MIEHSNVNVDIEVITPILAGEYLAKNKNFRALNERRAEHLAEQIKLDRWQLNGETIKFDDQGSLVDGQHRLKACILAGKPIHSVVTRGVDATNVDTGKVRTLSQLLESKGYHYSGQLASTGGFLFRFQNHGIFQSSDEVSRDDVLGLLSKYKNLADAVAFTNKTNQMFGRWSLHAALYFTFCITADYDNATRFYQSLMDGVELSVTNPIYLLREKLITHKLADAKLPTNPYAGQVIKAWNLWMTKGAIKSLRFNYQTEGLPKIVKQRKPQKDGLKFKGD